MGQKTMNLAKGNEQNQGMEKIEKSKRLAVKSFVNPKNKSEKVRVWSTLKTNLIWLALKIDEPLNSLVNSNFTGEFELNYAH